MKTKMLFFGLAIFICFSCSSDNIEENESIIQVEEADQIYLRNFSVSESSMLLYGGSIINAIKLPNFWGNYQEFKLMSSKDPNTFSTTIINVSFINTNTNPNQFFSFQKNAAGNTLLEEGVEVSDQPGTNFLQLDLQATNVSGFFGSPVGIIINKTYYAGYNFTRYKNNNQIEYKVKGWVSFRFNQTANGTKYIELLQTAYRKGNIKTGQISL